MPSATRFALHLQQAFIEHSDSVHFGEIAQFRSLMDAFAELKRDFLLEEYHGSKHQVYFDTSLPYLRARARCELCDILIIAYSRKNGLNAKATFLQAKISNSIFQGIGQPTSKAVEKLSFAANLEQWDLLANRPKLYPTTVFQPPQDLLKTAAIPSIGSFGVFYIDRPDSVEFFYCSADYLRPVGNPNGKSGRLETIVTLPNQRFTNGTKDIPYCNSILSFGHALYSLNIGSPVITTDASARRVTQEPLASWVKEILKTYASVNNPNSVAALTLLQDMGQTDQPGLSPNMPVPSLFLLEVDGT